MTTPLDKIIIKALDDNKAIDIIELDVRELTGIMDTMIICTATSTRHAKTLSEKVVRAAKGHDVRPYGIEGESQAEWILIDFSETVVHIMLEATREFYDLEKLWSKAAELRKTRLG